jgi:hypothetical protein
MPREDTVSYDIDLFEGRGLARDARRTGRQISRVRSGGEIRKAAVDVETDVTLDKIDAITATTGQALGSVAKVAQAETALAQNFPGASGRLAFIAERHMLHVSDVLDDFQTKVRRK